MLDVAALDWDGARNLADLGGLPLIEGGLTRHRVIFRSAATEWLTVDGWRAAGMAGLTRVIDLRNAIERGRRPEHPEVDEAVLRSIEVLPLPTEDPDDPAFLDACGPWLDHPRSWTPNMTLYPAKFRRIFEGVADARGPVLIHCAGGRDRTGMVGSMLLALAGAETAAICANYESGFRGAALHRGHGWGFDPDMNQWTATPDREWTPEELDEAMAARLPALMDWAATTDVRLYLSQAGVSPDRLHRLHLMMRS